MKTIRIVALLFITQSVLAQETFPVNGVSNNFEPIYAFTNARIVLNPTTEIPNGTLLIKGNEIIATVAEAVWVIVPCYSRIHEDTINRDCPKRTVTPLEAIFVEGHTDPDPFDPKFGKNNWTLSAQRAINTFKRMIATQPLLDELRNNSDQHLFGVSGYEARRRTQRLPGQTEKEWKAADRRIDLRFIMKSLTPEMVKELEKSVGRQ